MSDLFAVVMGRAKGCQGRILFVRQPALRCPVLLRRFRLGSKRVFPVLRRQQFKSRLNRCTILLTDLLSFATTQYMPVSGEALVPADQHYILAEHTHDLTIQPGLALLLVDLGEAVTAPNMIGSVIISAL